LPWNPGLPAGLWPLRLRAVAKGTAADSLSLDVTAEGLRIGPEKDATLHATLREAARGTSAEIRLESNGRALVAADGSLPWVVKRDPLAFAPTDDGLDLSVTLDRFPLPEFLADPLGTPGYLDRGDATRAPRLAGRARIVGSPDAPQGMLRGTITFPAYDELAHYSVGIEARAAQDGDPQRLGAGADSTVRVSESLREMKPGLAARLSARRDSVEILDADLALPFEGAWNDADPADRELSFHARAEDLALDDLTPLFPGVLGLDGRVRLDVSAEGPLDDPRLAGDIDLENVEVRLRDRSWATARGNVHLAGSGRAPDVTGRIVVPSGSIRVPETPPTLYPTEGTALLLAQEEEFAAAPPNGAAADSTVAANTGDSSAPPDSTPAPPADATKLDVTVTVPSGVRLQGRGLDVELGGELEILRSGNEMSLVGSLDAQRGSMQYLGRRLEIESGTVTFYGSKDLNPTLNLSLAKQSGTVTVRVIVTGTLLKPRLELRSDPDMSQGDILAFLLFDRTSDTLTGEQTQRLSEQARTSAEQFAANRLAEELGQELGVDVLRYEQSASDSVQTRTITVGKYLSPDLLVQYEQGLENREGIGLVVEYFLGHGLRLEMRSHRQDQDGLVLGWERNY
ncbi:MAG: translocation/assembly module TamB, partial [Gemmatimonadetes bacterium]|nr:translocation/assembly module TamB [Gemmatimonadota bacterium]